MSCCDRFVMTESQDEFKMWQGLVGAHYTPYVDESGNLSWTNNGGLPNPATVNIKGQPGTGLEIKGIVDDVASLPSVANSGDVYLVGEEPPYGGYLFVDGGWAYIGIVGVGENGRGIVSIEKTGTSGLVDTYTITYTDNINPTTFTVTNGADGQPGSPGTPGAPGTPGVGVPTGGTTGQVLKKASSTNYDTEWGSVEALPTGGTTGQVLAKASGADYDTEWVDQSGAVLTVNSVTPDQNGDVLITADDIETDSNQSIQDALDNIVHVGTSAPSDPSVKIWLDTDEPGMSGVSSVNNKTGTVVLDLDDIGFATLVWTNASPTSQFAAQTVSLDLSDYDAVLLEFSANSTNATVLSRPYNICVIGQQVTPQFILNVTGTTASRPIGVSRIVDTTSTGITFSAGYSKQLAAADNTQPTTENNRCVPLRIWGIKGVA